jgi:hypothetical protein
MGQYAEYVLWAYRTQPHSATEYSPDYLIHGREMKGPGNKELSAYTKSEKEPSEVK